MVLLEGGWLGPEGLFGLELCWGWWWWCMLG